jgi:hypothetical protein
MLVMIAASGCWAKAGGVEQVRRAQLLPERDGARPGEGPTSEARGLPKEIGATRHDLLILYWYLPTPATWGHRI